MSIFLFQLLIPFLAGIDVPLKLVFLTVECQFFGVFEFSIFKLDVMFVHLLYLLLSPLAQSELNILFIVDPPLFSSTRFRLWRVLRQLLLHLEHFRLSHCFNLLRLLQLL